MFKLQQNVNLVCLVEITFVDTQCIVVYALTANQIYPNSLTNILTHLPNILNM